MKVVLTTKETKILRKILEGKTLLVGVDPKADPYPDYVDWFDYEDKGHPLSNAPEPKRWFIPSRWENKKVFILTTVEFRLVFIEAKLFCNREYTAFYRTSTVI